MAWDFSDIEAAEVVIQQIEEGKISNRATADGLLCQIITNFPDTWIARKAKELRDRL